MIHNKKILVLLITGFVGMIVLIGLGIFRNYQEYLFNRNDGSYSELLPDESSENPLQYIREDFTIQEDFHTNVPIVILTIDEELPDYKSFDSGTEETNPEIEPYTTGTIRVIGEDNGDNYITDKPSITSCIQIKKRGHSSYTYDKSQYLIKTVNESGQDNQINILGMGNGDSWVLNGSMADKSMIRNYLAYRIASEIGGNRMSPDSRFCEVMLQTGDQYEYLGIYLLMETISRGESRVDIDQYRAKNVYSSYIVRRDRFTNFDPMLETYGRVFEYSEQWIGLKYPSSSKVTEETLQYISNDFSKTEQILYADDESVFKIYDKYIDVRSFIDYFLINEYFGNYDAGEHSTYMYKNSGERLHIGPVWDFDQAMNNYFAEEMNASTLAFQTKPIFGQLTNDKYFIEELKDRYSVLSRDTLSEDHVFDVIDETTAHLKSAREREWYRWAADYEDDSMSNYHNYYLQSYLRDDLLISRFNDNYNQEIYNIKNYLHAHAPVIQTELSKLIKSATFDSSLKSENVIFLVIILVLFMVPSFFINRKG